MAPPGSACHLLELATCGQRLPRYEQLIDDQQVGAAAELEPPDPAAEQAARLLRHRGDRVGQVDTERAEPGEAVGEAAGAPARTPSARRATPPETSISVSPSR